MSLARGSGELCNAKGPSGEPESPRSAAGSRSADGAAAEQVDDRQQDHGAHEGDQETREAEVPLRDRAGAEQRGEKRAGEKRADDADDDVEDDALLSIGPHDHAGDPADQATYDEHDDDVHK